MCVYDWPYRCVSSSSEIGMCQCAGEIVFDDIVDTYVCIVSILYVIYYWILLACMWVRNFYFYFFFFLLSFSLLISFFFFHNFYIHTYKIYTHKLSSVSCIVHVTVTKRYKIYICVYQYASQLYEPNALQVWTQMKSKSNKM